MKSRKLLYHFLFWAGIYLLWVLIFRRYSVSLSRTMTIEFCYLLFITADFYAINYFTVPQLLVKRQYVLFGVATLFIIAFSAWLRALVAVQMNLHFFHGPLVDFNTLYLNSVVNIALWVLLVTLVKMILERIQTQRQLELLEKERAKNELDYLKAQINPHALFNSLNTIYGHIDKSNQLARNSLLQFSGLLRYQLYECGAEKVELEKEIEYLKNYVAFHRLRKDDKLIINFDAEEIEKGFTIPPLLLVVLVENAFKFVSHFLDKENRITIRIATKGAILQCSFINTTALPQAGDPALPGGIGIANLRRRLALLYPQKHELRINAGPGLYESTLQIDLA